MSKANSPIKVLKTAIKRLNKGWTTGTWLKRDQETGQVSVCLEGAIFGHCVSSSTPHQKKALETCEQIIFERWKDGDINLEFPDYVDVDEITSAGITPRFNDVAANTVDDVIEICKLAIIRLETGGPIDDDEFIEFDPDGEELMDLLPGKK